MNKFKERLKKFIGDPPKVLEEYMNKDCPVCGQPFNKSIQIEGLHDFFLKDIESLKVEIEGMKDKRGILPDTSLTGIVEQTKINTKNKTIDDIKELINKRYE